MKKWRKANTRIKKEIWKENKYKKMKEGRKKGMDEIEKSRKPIKTERKKKEKEV